MEKFVAKRAEIRRVASQQPVNVETHYESSGKRNKSYGKPPSYEEISPKNLCRRLQSSFANPGAKADFLSNS